MTNEEAERTFAELSRFLNDIGLGWIEDSVQDDIQLGALEEVTESDMPAGEFTSAAKLLQPSYRKTIRKSANFLVRKEYSQKERLTMLIDAIAEVVVHGNDCEASVLAHFRETGGPAAIQFVSERRNVSPVSGLPDEVGRRYEASVKLSSLLEELRADINA